VNGPLAREREHQDAWYARAIEERFFEREGFRRLIEWNLARLRRSVPLTATSRVLSLGCGTGEYELALAPHVASLVAVDLSPVAIAEARRRIPAGQLPALDFREGSIGDVQFAPRSFDVVYAMGVLHHLGQDERRGLLTRARQWLDADGWFYARDPNAHGILRLAAGWSFRHSSFHSPNEAALRPRDVCGELTSAGFHAPRVGYTDVLSGPLPWLVGSRSAPFWRLVFALDRAWLATPGLRRLASQFDVRARR
jgi:SAM-dependent methyltransferase